MCVHVLLNTHINMQKYRCVKRGAAQRVHLWQPALLREKLLGRVIEAFNQTVVRTCRNLGCLQIELGRFEPGSCCLMPI